MRLGIIIAAGALVLGTSAFAAVDLSNTVTVGPPTGVLSVQGGANWDYATGPEAIVVTATVENYASQSWSGSTVNFRKGGPGTIPPAYLTVTMVHNVPGQVSILPVGAASLDKLKNTGNIYGYGAGYTAPVYWAAADGANNQVGPWQDSRAIAGNGIDFPNLPSSSHIGTDVQTIRITAAIPDDAPAGPYVLDPICSFVPAM